MRIGDEVRNKYTKEEFVVVGVESERLYFRQKNGNLRFRISKRKAKMDYLVKRYAQWKKYLEAKDE